MQMKILIVGPQLSSYAKWIRQLQLDGEDLVICDQQHEGEDLVICDQQHEGEDIVMRCQHYEGENVMTRCEQPEGEDLLLRDERGDKDIDLVLSSLPAVLAYFTDRNVCCVGIIADDSEQRSGQGSGQKTEDEPACAGVREWVCSPEAISRDYLQKVLDHHRGLPHVIALTRRLLIRESVLSDYEQLRKMFLQEEKAGFADASARAVLSDKDAFASYIRTMYSFFDYGMYTVCLKESGACVGWCGLSPAGDDMDGMAVDAMLGYMIRKDCRNKGMGSEACRKILEYASRELGLEHIGIAVNEKNTASMAMARHLLEAEKDINMRIRILPFV